MSDLQEFDLEVFFHDDTFVDMLEYRKKLEESLEQLTAKETQALLYLDGIVVSYCNLYKNRKLIGYEKLSFKVLEEISKISQNYIDSYIDMVA
jgi:hypothetical protein